MKIVLEAKVSTTKFYKVPILHFMTIILYSPQHTVNMQFYTYTYVYYTCYIYTFKEGTGF